MNVVDPSVADEILRQKVIKRIKKKHPAAILGLQIGVLHRIVHLAGSVSSLGERTQIEELVRSIGEVRQVVNRIDAPGAPLPARQIHLDLNIKAKDE